jgi:hypothetical protein
MTDLIPQEQIEQVIYSIRGQRVMLDKDLAVIYGVKTKILNQAVRRNLDRFPSDFMFQLTYEEARSLRSQIVTLENIQVIRSRKGRYSKYLPYAFTEHGVAMLSSVLRSREAIHINIAIMRVFSRLRETLALHKDIAVKLRELEQKIAGHDESIQALFGAIRQLMAPPGKPKRQIGFHVREKRLGYRRR